MLKRQAAPALFVSAVLVGGCTGHSSPMSGSTGDRNVIDSIHGAQSVTTHPRIPVAGHMTNVNVRGTATAGRSLIPVRIDYGDGDTLDRLPLIDCAAPLPRPRHHAQPFVGTISHTWTPGIYTVKVAFLGACARGVPPHDVSFQITVT